MHCALPEVDFEDINTSTRFLHRSLRVPILISGMTGGIERGALINRRLAAAAQAVGCAMGVGSQRVAIENPAQARHFRPRDVAPNILLLANLGAVQLNYGYGVDECQRAVEMIEADALVLHLNPLQEAQAGMRNVREQALHRRNNLADGEQVHTGTLHVLRRWSVLCMCSHVKRGSRVASI
jgi:isopentenyl-diphosphate delta-isomerase